MKFPINVFVYGTLKKGHGNHRVMEAAQGKFVRCATINATMFSLGAFPAICLTLPGEVDGEIYSVPNAEGLKILDGLEGYPRFYNRSEVRTVECSTVQETPVWVYHMAAEKLRNSPEVESGVWGGRDH